MELDEVLLNIIRHELDLDDSRIALYGQRYRAPKDNNLYIVVSSKPSKGLSLTNSYSEDSVTGDIIETKAYTGFVRFIVEATSVTREAYQRKEEILMSLVSLYGINFQQEHSCKFWRDRNPIIDLTFISGATSLYRFNINIIGTFVKTKQNVVDYYDRFRDNEVVTNR
jgi:hypothetical protein